LLLSLSYPTSLGDPSSSLWLPSSDVPKSNMVLLKTQCRLVASLSQKDNPYHNSGCVQCVGMVICMCYAHMHFSLVYLIYAHADLPCLCSLCHKSGVDNHKNGQVGVGRKFTSIQLR
jgi:hypothetical protein